MTKTALQQDIIIPFNSIELHGVLSVPQDAIGIVIFCHGHGSSRLSPRNTYVAGVLQKYGMATLLVDLLTESEDESSKNRFDIEPITDRLLYITNWIRHYRTTKYMPIAHFGASTGAAAVLKGAVEEKVVAIVSRGGRPDLVMSDLKKVTSPTLLIVGGNDELVLQLNRRAFQKLSCEKAFHVVDGASHLFQEAGKLEEVARIAAKWFSKWLKAIEHVQE